MNFFEMCVAVVCVISCVAVAAGSLVLLSFVALPFGLMLAEEASHR